MSLRDQLLAKGLVSKRKARKANQDQRRARRDRQGNREKKKVVAARERASKQAVEDARQAAASQAGAASRLAQQAAERALQIRNTILGTRIRPGRGATFHHRALDGPGIVRLSLGQSLARKLQRGEAAIAAMRSVNGVSYEPISHRGAERLAELAPGLLVHWAQGEATEADLAFSPRDWEPSLQARRATQDDLVRFKAALAAGQRTGA